jgi:hypothetical protein
MTTKKERELIAEITNLAIDVNIAGNGYAIGTNYIGHVHAFEVRILRDDDLSVMNDPYEWAHLSGGETGLWDEHQAVERLESMLQMVKTYHPQYDADGVKL